MALTNKKLCLICGKSLPPRNKKYCSNLCLWESNKGRPLSEEHKKKLRVSHLGKTRLPKKEVLLRGKLFKVRRVRRKCLTKTFYEALVSCPVCNFDRWVALDYLKKQKIIGLCYQCSREKKEQFKKICRECGKIYFVNKYRFSNSHFCSQKCHCQNNERREKIAKARTGIKSSYRGESHWNWKGGITGENKKERNKFTKFFSKKVFEKDNFICQICGIRGGKLHANHLKDWAEFPELRFNLENCQTLCRKCHFIITYGKEMGEKNKWSYFYRDRR